LGADPPSHDYGVAGEAAPSSFAMIMHAMFYVGGTCFVVFPTSVGDIETVPRGMLTLSA